MRTLSALLMTGFVVGCAEAPQAPARQVAEIDKNDQYVCTYEVPTGTRFGYTRCRDTRQVERAELAAETAKETLQEVRGVVTFDRNK